MSYCGPKGIPLSTFLAWPVDDQAAALHWQAEESLRCRNCGTAAWEWEEDPHAYHATESVCKGCSMVEAAQKSTQGKVAGTNFTKAELFPGLQVRLVKD